MQKDIENYKRKAVFCNLKEFDASAKEHSYIEITEWNNGDGFDINAFNYSDRNISISYCEFDLIKKLVKKLNK
jgi:hypothetical protein